MPDPPATILPKDTTDVDPWQNPVYEHILDNQNVPGFEAAYRLLDLADSNLRMYTRPRFELYNLGDDPWEINDLAENPNCSETLECMKLMLTDWMDGYGDNIERP